VVGPGLSDGPRGTVERCHMERLPDSGGRQADGFTATAYLVQ
jgi:hypothetical protein